MGDEVTPGYVDTQQTLAAMTYGLEAGVSEVGAGGDVEDGQLGAVAGQGVQGLVRQLVTGGQVQYLNVVAVLGEADQSRISNILTTIETEALEEASTPLGQVLHNNSLNVHLELKQIHFLPVGAIQG